MRNIGIIALLLVLLVGFYAYNQFQYLQQEITELNLGLAKMQHQLEILNSSKEASKEERSKELQVYFVHSAPTDFLLVPVTRRVSEENATPLNALNLLIEGPLPDENLYHSLPNETKVLNLSLKDNVVTVDFSKELSTRFTGGSQLESHLVSAIVFTLTQFTEIERVQILIEGEQVESIGGHVNISRPLP